MTERFKLLKKRIFESCAKYELQDASDLILLQSVLLKHLEEIEDSIFFEELSTVEYLSLKFSTREIITTISWSIYHNYYNELYVSKTFIDLLDEHYKKEGGE